MIDGFDSLRPRSQEAGKSHTTLYYLWGSAGGGGREGKGRKGTWGFERMVSLSFHSVRIERETCWKEGIESKMKRAIVGERKGEEGTKWRDWKVLSVWVRLLLSNSNLHSRSSSDQ